MSEMMLHHSARSSFTEKVRLALGSKGLAGRGVGQPALMARPALLPLTGAYRKIPVVVVISLAALVFAAQARAAPFGSNDRAAWLSAAGGEPDRFFHFDESSAGDDTVPNATSVGNNASPLFLVQFHAALGIEFLPFQNTAVLPAILRNQTFQMSNATGQDGHDPGRARDALLGNFPSPNPTSDLEGRAIRFRFLEPVRSFGVRVNDLDGGHVDAFAADNSLILSQALPGGFAGIVSDVPIDHIHVVNTFDADIQFGLYDFQYHTMPAEPVPALTPWAAGLLTTLLLGLVLWRARTARIRTRARA